MGSYHDGGKFELDNLIVIVDFNNYQGLEKTTDTHPFFMPLGKKFDLLAGKQLKLMSTQPTRSTLPYQVGMILNLF